MLYKSFSSNPHEGETEPAGSREIAAKTNGPNEFKGAAVRLEPRSSPPLVEADLETPLERPKVKGKFLFVGDEKFWIRGVTYGTFRPDETGAWYPACDVVRSDFKAMADAGLNTIRVYTVPPTWLLDLAAAHGLRLMVGLHWEQHLAVSQNVGAFLENTGAVRDAIDRIGKSVKRCAKHPALLCYAIGNEIPAPIVRWYGAGRIQHFLANISRVVKKEDPTAIVTYPNYPTTEYLDLPFVDFLSFNVYLESKNSLSAYLARLQNIAGEKPLVLTETGLDSRRNGPDQQAEVLRWQLATIFESGCAGAFIYAWTDEWHCGGRDVEDWDFGLTTRERKPKPALASVSRSFKEVPFEEHTCWPRISVVVCSYNGGHTIGQTLAALDRLNYENYEVIVVDDGSTDNTASIAKDYGVKLIQTDNKGLANARNLGMQAAIGELIAYIDDDAYPDPDWLKFLASLFKRTDHAGIGGPNIAPEDSGLIADCVARAPGGPVHVLLSDEVAEHIPGCNMAFRLERLRELGGFDARFRVAGDDVDVCWRMQERGWSLGFSPAAVVWHHRRRSVGAYWRQQKGYAHAESLLSHKWPQKYNQAGHLTWQGRLYGSGVINFFLNQPRIYHGTWGSAPFQSVYAPSIGLLSAVPLMPEWYFLVALLGLLSLLGLVWSPLFLAAPFFLLAVAASLIQAGFAAIKSLPRDPPPMRRLIVATVTGWLHLIQPLARLVGRMRHGVGPWNLDGILTSPVWLTHKGQIWSEEQRSIDERLTEIETALLNKGAAVKRGGEYDRWDLEICGGLFGSIRTAAMLEEHAGDKQLLRLRAWPRVATLLLIIMLVLGGIAALAASDAAWIASFVLAFGAIAILMTARGECAEAMQTWQKVVEAQTESERCSESRLTMPEA